MRKQRKIFKAQNHRIEQESYSLNILRHYELDDRNLVALNTDEHLKMREEFRKRHEETIQAVRKVISQGMA